MMELVPSSDLRVRVLGAVRRESAPTRRAVFALGVIAAAGAVVLGIAAFDVLGGFDAGGRPLPLVAATTVGWLATALATTWIVFGGRSMTGRPRPWLLAASIGAPLFLELWTRLWGAAYPEVLPAGSAFDARALGCANLIVTLALVPTLMLALSRRGSDAVQPGATGAALGAAMAVWSGLLLNLTCSCANPTHVAVGHVLPVALLALVGSWIGRRIIALHVDAVAR